MGYHIVETHISEIRAGDTVRHGGDLRTVCNADLRRSEFMGWLLFGDSYRLGRKPVELVIIERAIPAAAGGDA